MDELKCAECGEIITEEGERYTLEDGTVICEECFDASYGKCDFCDRIVPEDELIGYGDCRVCRDCLEEECPSFDEKENEEETTEAYETMCRKYIGKRTMGLRPGEDQLDQTGDSGVYYSLTVTVNDAGVITELSRLTAQMLLSESVRSSNWAPYRIDEDDYMTIAEEMLDRYVMDEDDPK